MENLVFCPCGHPLSNHDFEGCNGERLRRCPCARDKHAALEAAVDRVQNKPAVA